MIVSTLSSYPKKKISHQFGIVSGYDDAWRPVRLNVAMTDYLENAIKDMEKQAEKLGANAILGINFALMDATKPIVMGTAVLLEDE